MKPSTQVKLQLAAAVAAGTYANTISTQAVNGHLPSRVWERVDSLFDSMPQAMKDEIERADHVYEATYGGD